MLGFFSIERARGANVTSDDVRGSNKSRSISTPEKSTHSQPTLQLRESKITIERTEDYNLRPKPQEQTSNCNAQVQRYTAENITLLYLRRNIGFPRFT